MTKNYKKLVSFTEAQTLIRQNTAKANRETIVLSQALGRILAEEIITPSNIPAFDNAAMDGFAE